jgi:hypothetical protein
MLAPIIDADDRRGCPPIIDANQRLVPPIIDADEALNKGKK